MNGYVAVDGQFPYQVSIIAPEGDGRFYVHGGSIISPNFVLTVAHAVYPHREVTLRFGSNDLWNGGDVQRSSEFIVHPEYDQNTLHNNIALVKLPQQLDLVNGRLRSVALPSGPLLQDRLVGNRTRVAGWGIANNQNISETLNFADLQIIDNGSCRRVFGAARVIDSVICGLGWFNRNQAICGGDSGSALVTHYNGQWTQVGIASFGALNACDRGFPSAFTRVSEFVGWIVLALEGGVPSTNSNNNGTTAANTNATQF